jgi:hypothetical protein
MMAFAALGLILTGAACDGGRPSHESHLDSVIVDGHTPDGEPLPDRSVDSHGTFVAKAKNLFTKEEYLSTGADRKQAKERALEICRTFAKDEAGCVISLAPLNTVLLPRQLGGRIEGWSCFASETSAGPGPEDVRTWIDVGKTKTQAQENAIKTCGRSGGVNCAPGRCFNTDRDKAIN